MEGPAVDPRRYQTLMEAPPFPLSSRVDMGPARPPKGMKNTFCLATALHGSVALSFFIPSAAEGSAVGFTDHRSQGSTNLTFVILTGAQRVEGPAINSLIFSGPKTCNLILTKLSLAESADYLVRQAAFLANGDSSAAQSRPGRPTSSHTHQVRPADLSPSRDRVRSTCIPFRWPQSAMKI